MMQPDYDAHALHTAAAEPRSELWRLGLGVVVMVGLYIAMALIYRQMIMVIVAMRPAFGEEVAEGSTPLAMYVLLFSFGLITAAVFVGARMVHKRDGLSVCGPISLAVPQFTRVLGALFLLAVVLTFTPPFGMDGPLVPAMAFGLWVLVLPISMFAVFVQVSAEEVFFRGYLQQQLAARFRSPFVWMLLPSVLFAFGHYQPIEAGQNAVLIAVWAGLFGILMADLTARSGTIGPAVAVHFMNNAMALLYTSLPDSLGGLALWHTPFGMADEATLRAWLPVDFALMLVMWLAARVALRR